MNLAINTGRERYTGRERQGAQTEREPGKERKEREKREKERKERERDREKNRDIKCIQPERILESVPRPRPGPAW